MVSDTAPLLACADIRKSFGGVPVLKGITLDLQPGTVTALAGENGAGKSTLMKIVSGQYTADHGSVSVQGHQLSPGNTRDAVRHGVAIVPQEMAIAVWSPELDDAGNSLAGIALLEKLTQKLGRSVF